MQKKDIDQQEDEFTINKLRKNKDVKTEEVKQNNDQTSESTQQQEE